MGIGLAAAATPAWGQKIAEGYPGFEVDLVYRAPDIEHPSAVTCDTEGNLFVGEDPMDMRGPATKEIDRIVLIRFDKKSAAPVKTVFCQNLSSVFGLLWEDGALYVMHAPHYSVFRDTDGDGVADERQDLAQGFGPPAGKHGFNDHIVTGIRLGLDRRVYVSVGDKGIQRAVGSDGSTITLEGGVVVRMTLDGRQLEIVSSGTRNHLDVAMDSLDNIFTYDNTDDGLGWWTRFTHHVPTGYYGYPYEHLKHPGSDICRESANTAAARPAARPVIAGRHGRKKYQRTTSFTANGVRAKSSASSPPAAVPRLRPRWTIFWFATATRNSGRSISASAPTAGRCTSPIGMSRSGPIPRSAADCFASAMSAPMFRPNRRARRTTRRWPLSSKRSAIRPTANGHGRPACLTRLAQPAIAPVSAALLASAEASKLAKVHALWTLNDIADRLPGFDPAPAWIAALDDRDADVRSQAARALGERRSRTATGRLVAAMGDGDAQVRLWAAIALGRVGDVSTAPRSIEHWPMRISSPGLSPSKRFGR